MNGVSGLLDVTVLEPQGNPDYNRFMQEVRMATMMPPFSIHLDNKTKVKVSQLRFPSFTLICSIS